MNTIQKKPVSPNFSSEVRKTPIDNPNKTELQLFVNSAELPNRPTPFECTENIIMTALQALSDQGIILSYHHHVLRVQSGRCSYKAPNLVNLVIAIHNIYMQTYGDDAYHTLLMEYNDLVGYLLVTKRPNDDSLSKYQKFLLHTAWQLQEWCRTE